jgi:pterin-4a-carbinolamine dehydratase
VTTNRRIPFEPRRHERRHDRCDRHDQSIRFVRQVTVRIKNRANAPNVDWGFATVTVIKWTNIISSASMIDMKTNDPTTIQAKQ